MEITDIRIRKTFETEPLKAVVSLTIDNELAIHDVKIVYANHKFFVVMPSKKNADGTYRDIVHPISSAFREKIETVVIGKYKSEVAEKTPEE